MDEFFERQEVYRLLYGECQDDALMALVEAGEAWEHGSAEYDAAYDEHSKCKQQVYGDCKAECGGKYGLCVQKSCLMNGTSWSEAIERDPVEVFGDDDDEDDEDDGDDTADDAADDAVDDDDAE